MTLLHPKDLHPYQRECAMHQLTNDDSMLWLQMGLGKTPVTLTTIVDRMRAGTVQKTLIFGPLRVIQAVWAREARKWSHTQHLRFSTIHGVKQKRSRALFADADIYLINYESMNWLAEELDHYYISRGMPLPFQMVVYDEVSKLKNSTTLRMKGGNRDRKDGRGEIYQVKVTGWRKILNHFKYRTGLTGTPASNGYLDLHGQFLAVDGGKRLGEYVTGFKDNYFTSGYDGWTYTPTELGKKIIEQRIHDIVKKMDAKDYLKLPPVNIVNVMVELPPKARKAYVEVEKNLFTQLDNGNEIEVFSKSSVSNKTLQFCLAEGTEVLTYSGWKPIEQFEQDDLIWDGVEWSNVYSLTSQGLKAVVELDGVWMTPDHKVLTVSGWKEAKEILNNDASEGFDRVKVRLPDSDRKIRINDRCAKECNVVGEMHLWKGVPSNRAKPPQSKQTGYKVVWLSKRGGNTERDRIARDDEDTSIYNLDQHEVTVSKPKGQGLPELRRSRYTSLRGMVRLVRHILERYVIGLPESPDDRKIGQQRELQQAKLPMGNSEQTVKQQTRQSLYQNTIGENDCDTGSSKVRVQRCNSVCTNQKRVERRRPSVTIEVKKTYDLINAGSRNRFTVRGADGQVFIAHNCNGSPYLSSESPDYDALHDAKLDALEEVLEEAAGSPVLCSYTFRADAERIIKRFKKYHPVNLTQTKSKDTEAIIDKWNSGGIKLLIGHPASMGHGVDGLQDSGSILVWFGLNWSLELYEQMCGRLNRQGQKSQVSIIRILCSDTVDLAVADALDRKEDDQASLKASIDRYRRGITTNELEVNFF